MIQHGYSADEMVVDWCQRMGIVRVEVELKKRLLSELRLNRWGELDDDKLLAVFEDQTSVFRAVDRSDEPDILAAIPATYRTSAAAWMAGQDLSSLMSRRSLFRHAKVLREFGLDVLQPRNIETFPVRVRVVDLVPLSPPDWYEFEPKKEAA